MGSQETDSPLFKGTNMIGLILLILVVLLLLGSPMTGYHNYGWAPSGGLGLIIVIILIVLLFR